MNVAAHSQEEHRTAVLAGACKRRDRKEPSAEGLLYLAQFMNGSGDGEPRRLLTGVSHIRGTHNVEREGEQRKDTS